MVEQQTHVLQPLQVAAEQRTQSISKLVDEVLILWLMDVALILS